MLGDLSDVACWCRQVGERKVTVSEARRYLAGPLAFGDPHQVNARKFLEKVEEAKEAVRACDAKHEFRNPNKPQGEKARAIRICECLESFRQDEAEQAALALVQEWKLQ